MEVFVLTVDDIGECERIVLGVYSELDKAESVACELDKEFFDSPAIEQFHVDI